MKKKIGTIVIAGQCWDVYAADSHDAELFANGSACFGTTWYGNYSIYISNELSGSRARRTIAHEVVHAYLYSTQHSMPESYTEEQVCDFVSIYGEGIYGEADLLYRKFKEMMNNAK